MNRTEYFLTEDNRYCLELMPGHVMVIEICELADAVRLVKHFEPVFIKGGIVQAWCPTDPIGEQIHGGRISNDQTVIEVLGFKFYKTDTAVDLLTSTIPVNICG